VGRVVSDSFAVIVTATAKLTVLLAADTLLWSINGWLENLLAVAATPARLHARFLFSSEVRSSEPPSKTKPVAGEYRNFCRVLTASLLVGLKAGSLAPAYSGDIGSPFYRH